MFFDFHISCDVAFYRLSCIMQEEGCPRFNAVTIASTLQPVVDCGVLYNSFYDYKLLNIKIN